MAKQYGSFGVINGLISDIPESEIEEMKQRVTAEVKEGILGEGHKPDDFYFESVVRQSYHNGDDEYPKSWDEPIFKNNVPVITVGIKATIRPEAQMKEDSPTFYENSKFTD